MIILHTVTLTVLSPLSSPPRHPPLLPASPVPHPQSCVLFCDPMSLTRALSMTLGVELFTGAQWAHQWVYTERLWPCPAPTRISQYSPEKDGGPWASTHPWLILDKQRFFSLCTCVCMCVCVCVVCMYCVYDDCDYAFICVILGYACIVVHVWRSEELPFYLVWDIVSLVFLFHTPGKVACKILAVLWL